MKRSIASSYAKRRTTFGILVDFITRMGAAYKPLNTNISTQALTEAQAKAATVQEELDNAGTALAQARINSRNLFNDAKKTVSRLILEMKSMDLDPQLIDKVKQLTRIYSARAKATTPAPAATTEALPSPMPAADKASQKRSPRLKVLEGVSKIVSFMKALPDYNSADEELNLKALIALQADLEASLQTLDDAEMQNAQAAQALRLLWNNERTGLCVRFNQAKAHVRAVDKGKVYKSISKLSMPRVKIS